MYYSWFTKQLPSYFIIPYMLAQPIMDYTEASDLNYTALGGTDSSYTEDNLSYESWVVE